MGRTRRGKRGGRTAAQRQLPRTGLSANARAQEGVREFRGPVRADARDRWLEVLPPEARAKAEALEAVLQERSEGPARRSLRGVRGELLVQKLRKEFRDAAGFTRPPSPEEVAERERALRRRGRHAARVLALTLRGLYKAARAAKARERAREAELAFFAPFRREAELEKTADRLWMAFVRTHERRAAYERQLKAAHEAAAAGLRALGEAIEAARRPKRRVVDAARFTVRAYVAE